MARDIDEGSTAGPSARPPHVVIIGGGFGGLTAARALEDAPVEVTLIDRSNHHLFQPLLYQVAMAGLSPAEIAQPIRGLLGRQVNARVILGEVVDIDVAKRTVCFQGDVLAPMHYDFLVVAAGAETNYFGHPEWAEHALGLKSLDDAIEIRRRVLVAFEAAEREADPARRRELLTFVVIGGGPTGVELAGAVAELSRFVLARDFRNIDPSVTRVLLVEMAPRILLPFDEALAAKAVDQLRDLGVEVRTGVAVTSIDADGVHLGDELLHTSTVIWGAGVKGVSLGKALGAELDRGGRVVVKDDCSIPGHPEVFAIGDLARFDQDGKPLPGVSPVAMQQARAVAKNIVRSIRGAPREAFRYVDKGTMATIGRSRAIAQVGRLRLSGWLAWMAWLVVHVWYLIGFRNRLFVMMDWAWSYFTYKRGARLITGGLLTPEGLRASRPRPAALGASDVPALEPVRASGGDHAPAPRTERP
ncbi:NAD(P)/FAD-dependent oxidoreductase [Myxococcota bacterium]|nr:NAD(P)/FAD-dependent oxidoreductase [Myxococcota bacterium]